ncbi:hypothetical protein [Nostoc sp.]|uniref:hypothetical protein n=1 Tax=Nostoc sp. TaxID=1180 RepID=UPI002FF85D5D
MNDVQKIAEVVAFMPSDEARWITGQNIRVLGSTGSVSPQSPIPNSIFSIIILYFVA